LAQEGGNLRILPGGKAEPAYTKQQELLARALEHNPDTVLVATIKGGQINYGWSSNDSSLLEMVGLAETAKIEIANNSIVQPKDGGS
jgi:hypothetical protein